MALPLMPKATAVWLIENTALSFQQIADFCGMHTLEVQGIADGEVASGIIGQDPIASGQITREQIELAEKDTNLRLSLRESARKHIPKKKGARYTPLVRRQDKPEAVAWLLKYHPYISNTSIIKLIGTTKKTIDSIREKTHWNIQNIQPKDPVLLGLCLQMQLNETIETSRAAAIKRGELSEQTDAGNHSASA